ALAQEIQFARGGVDGKGTHRAGRFALEVGYLVHGEQQFSPGIDFEEGGVLRLSGEAKRHERDVLRHLVSLGLEPVIIYALALRLRVGADVDHGILLEINSGSRRGICRGDSLAEGRQAQGNSEERLKFRLGHGADHSGGAAYGQWERSLNLRTGV